VMWVGRPLLHLRGLCAETALDTFYYPQLMPQEAADSSGGLGSPVLVWTGLSGIVGDPWHFDANQDPQIRTSD
jgi:hypothetical protein